MTDSAGSPTALRPHSALIAVASVTAVIASGLAAAAPAAAAVTAEAPVVISEVYGGGGNSGGVLDRDFIELANVSGEAVDLSGWSVQYASATGGTWQVTPLGELELPSGSRLLVGEAFGADTSLPGFEADVDGSIALSGSQGKVALVQGTAAVSGASGIAELPQVIDLVGWGGATHYAGGSGPAPGTSNSTSVSRDAEAANTADNAADFSVGEPSPEGLSGDADPDPEPEPEPEPETVAIADIQGEGDASPLAGSTVTTTGVVTARYPSGGLDGYVIQTPGTGGAIDFAEHTASDAVFVSAPGAVSEVELGDTVEVTGTVVERSGLTQLVLAPSGASVVADAAAPEPAAVAWPRSAAHREALESMLIDPQGDYTVSNTYTTNQYGEVGLASGDSPLRQPTDVARPGSAEADEVAAENAARAVTLDDGSSANYLSSSNSSRTPAYVSLEEPVVVGASVTFAAPMIVDYRNGLWKLNPTVPLVGDGTGVDDVAFSNPRTAAPEEVGGDVTLASFNVLNYFTTLGTDSPSCVAYTDRFGDGVTVRDGCAQRGAWDDADLARQQTKLVAAIEALDADVVGLMEIENSAALGEQTDEATAALVSALNAASEEDRWAYVVSSPELPPVSEQDVITNAIIYRPAKVSPVGAARALGDQSGDGEAFGNAREPIGQVFQPADDGEPFLFVVNHFKSKGSAGPWPGDADTGDGQGASNESRVRQATALRDWVNETRGPVEAVALAGDFNSYGMEDPLQVLYDAGYTDVEQHFDVSTQSYSFSGLSGSLDHILLNRAALGRATGADVWNINSGESVALEYSRHRAHATEFYAPDVYRSSDHDPVLVGLAAEAPPVELTLLGINDFHGRIDADTVAFAGTVEELRAAASGPTVFVSAGDNIGASLFASSIAQDKPTIDVLNALELEASAVGNHEFDRGWNDLQGRVSDLSDYPQLGANVYLAGTRTPALSEYSLVEEGGLTIGFIGAVTEETPTLVTPSGITDLSFGDPVEAINRVAAQLSDGDEVNGEADVIVALLHEGAGSGTPDGSTIEDELAAGGVFARIVNETSAEVDAIFTGHTHKQYAWEAPIPGAEATRPIVQTGSYGETIGEVVLTVDPVTGEISAHTERLVPRTTTPEDTLVSTYPRVAEVADIVKAAEDAADEIGATAIGEVEADITTAFSGGSFVDGVWTGGARDDRAAESALGNTVATMLRDQLSALPDGAEIGVANPGGLRAELWDTQAEFEGDAVEGLPDGTISYSQARAVLPFNNTLALVTLTGAQFVTMLEQQWQTNPGGTPPSRPYLQLGLSDNVSYTYDASQPEGSRITSVTIDGEPIDPEEEYRIGTFSFLAAGGDNFRVFLEGSEFVDTGLVDYEAWMDYIADNSPLVPSFAKQAVQVAGLPGTVSAGESVTFDVSGLDMTSQGAPENTSLTAALGDESLGETAVENGTATVTVTIPADAVGGDTALTLTAPASGTVVRVPLTIDTGSAADPQETTTDLFALLPVHINRLLPTTLIAIVDQAEGTPDGVVEFREGDSVVATSPVRRGIATHTLGRLSRGTHHYTAVFVPADPEVSTGSTSGSVRVRVVL